jgi:hypothetical protein
MMKDEDKTKEQLINELVELRGRMAELEASETERKRAEEERERLVLELQDALAKVKTLSGLLPICASCKKVRNEEGHWHQLERYIQEHSELVFSHTLCPECAEKLYPELLGDDQ